jgi:hypothetical protein
MPAVVENANCAVIAENNNFDQVDRLMISISSPSTLLRQTEHVWPYHEGSVEGAAWFSMGT